ALDGSFDDARPRRELLGDPAVEQLPERRDADERMDAPRLEGLREALRGQLVEVGDLGADQQRDEEATRKLEGVVEGQHREEPLADVEVEERTDLRGERGEVAVGEKDAL